MYQGQRVLAARNFNLVDGLPIDSRGTDFSVRNAIITPMLSFRLYFALLAVFLFCFLGDSAEARNPPPVFESDYVLPKTETPGPTFSDTAENFVTVGMSLSVMLYALFLILAGLAVHRWRSRKVLFGLAVCSVLILGFLLHGCPCPVGMFQNLVQVFIDPSAGISWTVILLFTLPLLAALFWGRIFCSSVCPLGAVQELTATKNLKISDRFEHIFGLFRFFWLGIGVFCVIVGLGYIACRYDPFIAFFQYGGMYHVLIFGLIVLAVGFFIGRPFCRFLCPYGALLGICGSLAARKVSITPGQCDQCKLCEHVCPYNAILAPTKEPTVRERRYGPMKMVLAVFALPIIVFVFAQMGNMVAPRLASLNQDVRTAQLLYLEETGWEPTLGSSPETRGLMQTGTDTSEIKQRGIEAYRLFGIAGMGLGVWIGLVIGVKWILLTLRHRRLEYEVDSSRCFACGRCFWYCPNQKEQRLLLIGEQDSAGKELQP